MSHPGTLTWIVGNDPILRGRIERTLRSIDTRPRMVSPSALARRCELRHRHPGPDLIVLDIRDLREGIDCLEILKRSRLNAPIIALTSDFSREFALGILSQGVHYYLPRDFCEEELLGVGTSLLKPELTDHI